MQLRGSIIIKRRGVEGSLGYWGCGFENIWQSDLFQLSLASPMWDKRFGAATRLSLASRQTPSKQGQLIMNWNCRSRGKTNSSSLGINYLGHFSFCRDGNLTNTGGQSKNELIESSIGRTGPVTYHVWSHIITRSQEQEVDLVGLTSVSLTPGPVGGTTACSANLNSWQLLPPIRQLPPSDITMCLLGKAA